MSIPGSGSRRIFTDRLLALAQVQAGQSGTASLAALIAALPTAASVLATDVFPKLSSASVASKASGTQIRTYVLGISGGVANIPEDATVGSAPPAAPGSKIIVTEDGGSEISFIGHGAFSAGVRGIMASGTLASPTAISVAGVTHLAFLGGTGYDGTSWITTSKGLFSVRPAGTWSDTSHPTKLTFETTAAASTTRTSRWEVSSDGHLLGVTDDAYDIGASGATRPRRGYFGTELLVPLVTATTLAGTLSTATQNSVTTMSSLTTIGTLVVGAVPASLVTAGTFGTGNYTFPADVTLSAGVLSITANDEVLPAVTTSKDMSTVGSSNTAAQFTATHSAGSGTAASVLAWAAVAQALGAGTITELVGGSVAVSRSAGTVTAGIGLRVNAITTTMTTAYGIKIEGITGGSTDYAIYTEAGLVRFGDVVNTTESYQVDGTKVVGNQAAAIADASGGVVIDAEARTALNDLLAKLRTHGLIAT